MHELAPLIKDLAIMLGIASIVTLLFQKIRQPIVLGYLIAGMAVGPYTSPYTLVNDVPNIKILSELGVIFLMFSLGLEFSFRKLKRVGFSSTITGLVEIVFMLMLGMLVGKLLGWSFYDSLFLSAALSVSSTTIIIKSLEELKLNTKRFAEIVFGVLVIEDLLAILLMVGLSTIVATNNVFSFSLVVSAHKLMLVTGAWFLAGYFLFPPLLKKIIQFASEETLTIFSVALCLLMVWVSEYFHYSAALGAFVMGSILAETVLVERITQLIRPIRDIFAAVFFISVGMLIDPMSIWQQLPLVSIICLVTIVGKLLFTTVGALLTGQNMQTSLRVGFSMAQIGEFSFIIAGLGVALGVTSDSLYATIVAVSAITTFTTPYLIRFSGYLANKINEKSPQTIEIKHGPSSESNADLANTKSIYAHAIPSFIVNALLIGIIFTLVEWWVSQLSLSFNTVWLGKMLEWFVAIVCAAPFIWGMLTACYAREMAMRKWPVVSCVIWFLTISELVALNMTCFETWQSASLAMLFAGIFFLIFQKYIKKMYLFFRDRLVENLNTHHAA